MRINYNSLIIGVALMLKANFSFSQQLDYKSLESSLQQAVKKVSVATVGVTEYDTLHNTTEGPTFSAVVISADGYILTAAHAAVANRRYQVAFPDGKIVYATGLGSIKDFSVDAAVIKILEPGNWPHAEMGWSSALTPFQPCFSLGYPGNMPQNKLPILRFGYITESKLHKGFISNTALMEPGDSGGPLFDINGRVIGIHSRIDFSLDENFEVPVDKFRLYWNYLMDNRSYSMAAQVQPQEIDPMPASYKVAPIPALENMANNFSSLISTLEPTCLELSSSLAGQESSALGTLVSLDNSTSGNSYIISKSSIVGNDSVFVSYKHKSYAAKVIARDPQRDLVLLEVAVRIDNSIKLTQESTDKKLFTGAGKFLLSPVADGPALFSVLGTPTVSFIPPRLGSYIGIRAEEKDQSLYIDKVDAGSEAETLGMKAGDRIISVNGLNVNTKEDFDWAVANCPPKTILRLKGKRNSGESFKKNITVQSKGLMTVIQEHPAEKFEGGYNSRRYGFRKVFIHDARLYPNECGSPVYDTEGNFMGINIARVSRTSSLAIPAEEVRLFLEDALKNQHTISKK
ncbi:PDZ domain-containing protein [Chitinophaga silvatica]|uniref:PDZ domain-containing protein n=1 Tax=Chitinophaga silvatica TaxID=2282649 RepID=A0A3E1Y3A8_9BACT|nr:trypsin-like peptidase domain-containing protein [Chitinophaga silvatica]RFS19168.1 PDZ domain-containing protein [Chitinophaga silvatica]